MVYSTFDEIVTKIKENINEKASKNVPYIFKGSYYMNDWNMEDKRPYLSEIRISEYDEIDGQRMFEAYAKVNLVINGREFKNDIYIILTESMGKYNFEVSFGLDKNIIMEKDPIQMALFVCDLNDSGYLIDRGNQYRTFKYDYEGGFACIKSGKEFTSIDDNEILLFLDSAILYECIFIGMAKISYIYLWIDDIDDIDDNDIDDLSNMDYDEYSLYMLERKYGKNILKTNKSIKDSIDSIKYDL